MPLLFGNNPTNFQKLVGLELIFLDKGKKYQPDYQ
jgi:hypothetical protein